ncbi:condensin complex non-SMC subunit Cnd1 [Lodderomyces elongisporus]|uniref:condensin complex non-SMC subunit Cnd1 n=1 Tax=Lodderomyces elongisporus TaxID=36914 RepID=UPI002926CA47|nr:condensin complex non-SMC subunit Cnd1 [Lodderomyces elongisporus]WLF79556.1 condensin complex non-SMC subunit Cnd1 [Lodderomyces elongisporus]
MDFNLQSYFNEFDVDKEYDVQFDDLNGKLGLVTDTLAHDSQAIVSNPELFEDILELAQGYRKLESKQQRQLSYLLASSFNNIGQSLSRGLVEDDYQDGLDQIKTTLERYGYLIYVLMKFLGSEDHSQISAARSQKKVPRDVLAKWNSNCADVENALLAIKSVLNIDLDKVFLTTPERDAYVELFSRPIINLMESPERMKVEGLRVLIYDVLAVAVTKHAHGEIMQHSIIQSLTYYAHLPPYMAIFLSLLNRKYDHPYLTERILREIAQTRFIANDTNGPKAIAEFITKLSELSPHQMFKQMTSISQLLTNTNFTLRCAVVEACGNVIIGVLKDRSRFSLIETANDFNGADNNNNSSSNDNNNDNDNDNNNNNSSSSSGDGEDDSEKVDNGRQSDEVHVGKLLDLLAERVFDQNPFVRSKAIQALTRVAESSLKAPAKRQQILRLAVNSLDDRSTLVRRNSIKLLGKLILKHPFQGTHGTQLSRKFWSSQLQDAEDEYIACIPKPMDLGADMEMEEDTGDEMQEDNAEEKDDENDNIREEQEEFDGGEKSENSDNDEEDREEETERLSATETAAATSSSSSSSSTTGESPLSSASTINHQQTPSPIAIARAKLKRDFYKDAVKFIKTAEKGTTTICRLLFSRNRNEAIDAMDFIVLADAFGIENANYGIKRMLHLVWVKGTSEEGKSVSAHLIDCYKALFLRAPEGASTTQKAAHIAKSLMGLTKGASVADLASLEKLLCMMYRLNMIHSEIIAVLWQVYKTEVEDTDEIIEMRRSSIKILGMLGTDEPKIIAQGFSSILNIGLNEKGLHDLELCRYSCIALQKLDLAFFSSSIENSQERQKEATDRIVNVLLHVHDDAEWFAVAEQAIDAIFEICNDPVDLCSDLIREKSNSVFASQKFSELQKCTALSQLLFIVGHVAIKTIVYLESLEAQFKKKRQHAETKATEGNKADHERDEELEMIGGTSEDDFADAVQHVREKELLYGQTSILAGFGALVKRICSMPKKYDNLNLQRHATLCLVKLMCISSIYCEENLPLLLSIMEKSQDPVIRCNCVLGLGDLAVSFNRLIDENTDFIYRRLTDENIMVQKTCLMTVTFLILAGQVKVKGQLSSMAKCLENSDQGISDMCRLFFTELATKDNAIYNGFIDIFSGLSFDESLSHESFKKIIKFLLGFVTKERQQKQLSEKLLVRLKKAKSEKEWKDIAFALETIPNTNADIAAILKEGYQMVSAK